MRRAACTLLALAIAACSAGDAPRDDFDLFRRADPYFNQFIEPDDALLWRARPGHYSGRALFGENASVEEVVVGSLGLRGGDPGAKSKPRVLCLGDSVTVGYEHGYPEYLAEELGGEVEVLSAGVPGYSIAQARRWYEDSLASLTPDVVVILLAWNDAKDRLRGATDTELMDSWWTRLTARFRGVTPVDEKAAPLSPDSGCCRVPPARYLAELAGLVNRLREQGVAPVLVTYPSVVGADAAAGLYPQALIDARRARLAAIREATLVLATQTGALVLDLAPRSGELLESGYFLDAARDPIHPSDAGARDLARRIAPNVRAALENR